MTAPTIIICDGDETGQELLDESLRVVTSGALGVELDLQHHDLSLAARRRTNNGVVRDAAAAMRRRLDSVSRPRPSPRRRSAGWARPIGSLREGSAARSSCARDGASPGSPHVVRDQPPSSSCAWPSATPTAPRRAATGGRGTAQESAWRTERIERRSAAVSPSSAFIAATHDHGGLVFGGPKWTVSPTYEGMLKEEMDAAAARHPEVSYRPN